MKICKSAKKAAAVILAGIKRHTGTEDYQQHGQQQLHGYGYMEGWIPDYDECLTGVFENN